MMVSDTLTRSLKATRGRCPRTDANPSRKGANIAGFVKVADAMPAYGVV
jgi:glutamate dehydrogenase/leucine dehydrogenase